VAKSTVERLMRANGWQGVRRQKKVRTTIPDPAAERAPDLVDRQFTVPAPNRLLVGLHRRQRGGRHIPGPASLGAVYSAGVVGWLQCRLGEIGLLRGRGGPWPDRAARSTGTPVSPFENRKFRRYGAARQVMT
jgi:hypothetical protein